MRMRTRSGLRPRLARTSPHARPVGPRAAGRDAARRLVAFRDESVGEIKSWKWDFGDGQTSTERHPQHRYEKSGEFTVTLWIEGPAGKSRRAKVWDLFLK